VKGKWLVLLANVGSEGGEVKVELDGVGSRLEGRDVLRRAAEKVGGGLEVGDGWVKGWVDAGGVGGWVVE